MKRNLILWLAAVILIACGSTVAPPATPEHTPKDAAPQATETVMSAASGAPSAMPAPETTATAQAAEPPLPQPGPPVVTLIDPGAEPRKPLRYTFKKAAETLVIDMTMDMSIQSPAMPINAKMPTMRMTLDVKPSNVDADGTVTADMVVKKTEILDDRPIPPEAKKRLEAAVQKVVGLKGHSVTTARGVNKESTVEASGNEPPETKQLLDSMKDSLATMSSPFPEEAVGKGAKWEVKVVISGPMTIVQKTTYTLKEATAKGATFDVVLVQNAPPQALKATAQLPPGATMKLKSHTGNGTGTQKVTFDKITPVSQIKMTSSSRMEVNVESQTQAVGVDMILQMAVKPK